MKILLPYELFERKGNYQLYRGDDDITEQLETGYILGNQEWDSPIRRNIGIEGDTISSTRNFNYCHKFFNIITEFDVEKISDNYKIVPFCENPDFWVDRLPQKKGLSGFFGGGQGLTYDPFNLKKKKYGEIYWKIKTDKNECDFGIAEELIVVKKLDFAKYVKAVYFKYEENENSYVIKLLKKKYPNVEIVNPYDSKKFHAFKTKKYKDFKKVLQY